MTAAVKNRTRDLIELPLQYHDQLQKIGARHQGVLFRGPSGTGKTLLGRIIAQQAGAVFHEISGPEIISKYVGQSEQISRSIFEDASTKDRAIIFFDEIDSVAPPAQRRVARGVATSRRPVPDFDGRLRQDDQRDRPASCRPRIGSRCPSMGTAPLKEHPKA